VDTSCDSHGASMLAVYLHFQIFEESRNLGLVSGDMAVLVSSRLPWQSQHLCARNEYSR